jgi:hypothetical protein
MKAQPILLLVLAVGVAFAWAEGAGLAAAWGIGGEVPQGDAAQRALNQSNDRAAVGEGTPVRGGTIEDSDDALAPFIINGAARVATLLGRAALFPLTLVDLGAPLWFAQATGGVIGLAITVGIVQFITGRTLR